MPAKVLRRANTEALKGAAHDPVKGRMGHRATFHGSFGKIPGARRPAHSGTKFVDERPKQPPQNPQGHEDDGRGRNLGARTEAANRRKQLEEPPLHSATFSGAWGEPGQVGHDLPRKQTTGVHVLARNTTGDTVKTAGQPLARNTTADTVKTLGQPLARNSTCDTVKTGGHVLVRNSTGEIVAQTLQDRGPRWGHYERVQEDLISNVTDEERDEHDRMLADTLHKRRPSEAPHPWLSRPRNPMRAAFPDRSARLREGRGMKGALAHPDKGTEWLMDGKCHCPTCKAAGAASHEVWSNKVCLSAKDAHPVNNDFWWSANFNSDHVGGILASRAPTRDNEALFRKTLGGKIKADGGSPRLPLEPGQETLMMPHRPFMPGARRPAGLYDKERRPEDSFKVRQLCQGSKSCSPIRSGVALVLSPHSADPPPPTKVGHIKKASGAFKLGYSDEAAGHTNYFNQEVYRFSEPEVTRGRNSPMPDYESLAGTTTRLRASKAEKLFNPDRAFSPSRTATLNTSRGMGFLLDGDFQNEVHAQNRQHRLKNDKTFSDLCTTASTNALTQKSLMSEMKALNGHTTSSINLSWAGA